MNEYLIRTGESIKGITKGKKYLIVYDRNNKNSTLIVNDSGIDVYLSQLYCPERWEYTIDDNSTLNLLSSEHYANGTILENLEQTKKKYLESREFFKCRSSGVKNFTSGKSYEVRYDKRKASFIRNDNYNRVYLDLLACNADWQYFNDSIILSLGHSRNEGLTLENIIKDKVKKHTEVEIPQRDYVITNNSDTAVAITASAIDATKTFTGIDYATSGSNSKEENKMLKIEDITTKTVGTEEEVKTTKINGEPVSRLTSGGLIERIEDEQKNLERLKKLPSGSTAIKNSISLTNANIARLIELLDAK